MLQQTQVKFALPYYERFMRRFPSVFDLAQAPLDEVLRLWAGLGYYARARNLHRAAQQVVASHHGRFPGTARELQSLPGVGRSTAAAIAVFAYGERAAILDGNARRVLSRYFAVGCVDRRAAVDPLLWSLAERTLPSQGVERYTQGLMDLGATLCLRVNPLCAQCPVRDGCAARSSNLQSQFPPARKRPARTVRELLLVTARHGDSIFLIKRPAEGVWGGLWSLPEFQRHSRWRAALGLMIGAQVLAYRRLPSIEHELTHLTLRLYPLVVDVSKPPPRGNPPVGRAWVHAAEIGSFALPAPVATLLNKLFSSSCEPQSGRRPMRA